ncbi:tetratricopeptide repeat protein [Leptolyngbya sp. FACHB-261]|uniref:tetratricopeptide repeat protein n=1 Tax=Leptolyngbya sp. FACHB-261 TaxID=2692806 RepID=UPI0016879244|nr:tetratricopeptide repeat protein [Leptolyngbya sp. FACHB-261]MBD2103906.1 tetratricopeptide repeat protein [Leptolyngbya sp. FACHB-261]
MRFSLAVLVTWILLAPLASVTLADPVPVRKHPVHPEPLPPVYVPPNPSPNYPPDVLPVARSLSPLELRALREQAERLQGLGTAQVRAKNTTTAFTTWREELAIRHRIGDRTAVANTLGRIGVTARQAQQSVQLQFASQGLQQLLTQADQQGPPLGLNTLRAIASAYEQMVLALPAIAVHERLLAQQRARGNRAGEIASLTALGRLNNASFRFAESAAANEQLLQLLRGQDSVGELATLRELEHSYSELDDHRRGLVVRQALVALYQQRQDLAQLPPLQIRLAEDYLALDQPDQALQTYQEAFALSRSLSQFYRASESLAQLAQLYSGQKNYPQALRAYNLLLQVQQQSDNRLGLLDTYAALGDLYAAQEQYTPALAAYQQGLDIAQSFGNHRLAPLRDRIARVQAAQDQP